MTLSSCRYSRMFSKDKLFFKFWCVNLAVAKCLFQAMHGGEYAIYLAENKYSFSLSESLLSG